MYLKDQAIAGIEWTAGARVAKLILQFIISVILARLLSPKDFGLIGMIVVFTGFAALFSEMGLGAALIQRKVIEERHLSSIFWLNIAVGLILTCIFFAAAPLISKFYNEPRLKIITMLVSVNFFLSSFKAVQFSILSRSMDFRKLAVIETTTMFIAGAFAITLALIGYGVWSLAWQMIITTIIGVILFWFFTDWRPRFQFDKNAVKELLGFSGNLLGFNVFNYWARNVDNLLVGKFISSTGLGIYSKAYGLMLMPLSQISSTLGRVIFPSLSKSQDDEVLTKRIYLKTIGAIALLTLPMMTGLFVVADSFVLALLGPKWEDVIPVLRVLCLVGITQSIGTTVGWIYSSQGRTDLMFRWGMVAGTIGITSFITGICIGSVIAVAYCYAMANILLFYHNFAIPGKLINMTFSEVLRCVSGKFVCALLMSAGVYLLAINMPSEWPHWLRLMVLVPFGMIFYVVIIHFLKLRAYLEIKELIREQWVNHFGRIKTHD
jgi:PST family polysaccharide transporter